MKLTRNLQRFLTRSRYRASVRQLALPTTSLLVFAFMLASFCAFGSLPLSAQETLIPKIANVDNNKPLLMQADEVTYDNQNSRVIAKGNVEIYYNDYALLADKVIYDQKANTLSAEGNVRIKEPSGAIVNADRITLTDDFRDGFIRSLKIVTTDDARIAAARAQRVDGETTIFDRGVFTPCKPCKDDPEKAPLWRVKARKIIHKKSEGNIYYEDAALEFFGVPVAYMPYFSHPDPTVKRRSGFLVPSVSQSDDLGFTVEIPYFYALAPNKDFTFNPRITTKQGVLWQGEWRHRMKHGAYSVKFAAIDELDPSSTAGGRDGFRGSIETEGAFSLGSFWNWGWDITLETDDTFRRFYKLDDIVRTNRVSKVYMIGQSERNYFEASLYHFGGLLADDSSNAESRVHPVIDYNYIFADPILGGELSFNTNVLSLSRDEGSDSNRIITELKWRRKLIDGLGQVYTPFFSARGDLYRVSNVTDPVTNITSDEDYVSRATATAGLTYSYPFVARTRNASHVVEPVAQIIVRPNTGSQNDVPNEDARSLVFDDTLLFDADKFSGYDRIETGVRANVGLRYTMQLNSGGYVRAVLGESIQISGENSFDKGTGLYRDQSDYVAGLYVQPNEYFTFLSQARFDQEDFTIKRTDVNMAVNYGPFTTSVNYAHLEAQPDLGIQDDRQEVYAKTSIQLADHWSLYGSIRYDLDTSERVSDSLGLKYADECFVLAVTYNETFVDDRDIDPDQTVFIRFELKHLGGTTINATPVVDDLIADSDNEKS